MSQKLRILKIEFGMILYIIYLKISWALNSYKIHFYEERDAFNSYFLCGKSTLVYVNEKSFHDHTLKSEKIEEIVTSSSDGQ